MLKIEEMFNIAEASELMYEAKYAYLLEGFTYSEASELMFKALNK